jgi:NAD(P)-dependent dehydrogenase (short-subunit alcohol dehydrogenase family)
LNEFENALRVARHLPSAWQLQQIIMRLNKKVALITGAGSGIGLQTALRFAAEGAKVVAVDINEENGYDVVSQIKEKGGEAAYCRADVSRAADCAGMIDFAESTYGSLHILFNNAGIMDSRDDDAESTEEEVWDLTMNINVKGVFLGCKYGIPALRRAGGGSIINTASFVAFIGAATSQIAYTTSKGAVVAMTKELAVRHARENIRVNALCPGPLRTELLMKFLDTEAKKQRRLVHIPMGRFGEAREMADAALFLASDESSYMTGSEMLVDGGITAAYVTAE